ncbi:hypothetical protein HWV62_10357 [Athelia sp. TMB]|nr:hypothetical protein HWV62_10357 [Athelia sp. TMB]
MLPRYSVPQEQAAMPRVPRDGRDTTLVDAEAPWCINSLTIGELPTILHKHKLPNDFLISHASLGSAKSYISATYDWVIEHYDGAIPTHKFALLVAYLFSRVAPKLGHEGAPNKISAMKGSTKDITEHVRHVAWVPATETKNSSSRKGVTKTLPFIVMITTTIIALSDPLSPLRKYMAAHNNSLGPWSQKHGSKCINAFNLVRLGVAYAHAPAIYGSPKYGSEHAWSMKTPLEIAAYAKRFIALLKSKSNGPYEATKLVFGTTIANSLNCRSASRGGTSRDAGPPRSLPHQQFEIKRKRARSEIDELELTDDELFEVKRRRF